MNKVDLQAYHKHITDTYDQRSANHDKSDWHRKTALMLLEELSPEADDWILDIGTGTGTIAYKAASLVGPNGKVVGVDLSEGMLDRAKEKLATSKFKNIEFMHGDMERLDLSETRFDKLYCASAFFCALDAQQTLGHWYKLLKPGGGLAFHALPETSYFWVSVARDILTAHGFQYLLNSPTGTIDKTVQLLENAGFRDIDIRVEESGYFMPLEKARQSWIQRDDFAPGQYPHPVQAIPDDILQECQREYEKRIEALNTAQGVWNDISMFYVYAFKL